MRRFRRNKSGKVNASTQKLRVDDIGIILTKKNVKNLNMRIKEPVGPVEISAPYWVTEAQVIDFVLSKKGWIKAKQQTLGKTLCREAKQATPEEIQVWKAMLSEKVPDLIAWWEPLMGVSSQKVVYRNMTSRWGSCNPSTGRICLNIQLAKYPPECLEYVVVHELCHLLERGHGPHFKELMTSFLPDWKQRRALLHSGENLC